MAATPEDRDANVLAEGGQDAVPHGEAVRLVDRLREEFASMQHATFSAGIALISHRSCFSDSMRAADAALYRAKASGRNCVVTAAADERTGKELARSDC